MNDKNNLTQGSITKTLIRFALPLLFANIIQALYGAVDLLVIGKYCAAESVAAVSTGTQVTQIITSIITGMTLGGTILVGRYIGMQKPEEAKKAIGTTLTLFAAFAIILTVIMMLASGTILRLLQTPEAAFAQAHTYVLICSAGIFCICGYNAISSILRGYGDSVRPMIFVAIACVMNIILDIIFVKYLQMNAAGTALATILSQGFSMIFSVLYLNRQQFLFTFRLSNFRIEKEKAYELARLSIPISFQECMIRLSFLYLTSVVNSLGVYAASAVGVASKYDVFAMLPATSIASALSAITAQNLGAQKPERIRKSVAAGLGIALFMSACFFIWAQVSPQSMIQIFANDPKIIEAGIPFFRTCSYDYLAVTFVFCLNGFLNGYSKTMFTMFSSCFGALALRMPFLYLVQRIFPDSLAMLGCVAPTVSGIMALYTMLYSIRLLTSKPQTRPA
ncbi:MAG: MATE family efflux transporter [Bacillus sp. (in: Bacteria)]|nr:MATE family efflux transporter [Bacillus sp. (in: firmicutes)]MCM1426116.1 MATE family efflux transporter [Eubacterium sp.]